MKRILLCCIIIFIIKTTKAQITANIGYTYNYMNITIKNDYCKSTSLPGITLGLTYNKYLNNEKDCYLNSGIIYLEYKNKLIQKHSYNSEPIKDDNHYRSENNFDIEALKIPLRVGYKYNISKLRIDYLIGFDFNAVSYTHLRAHET